MSSTEALGALAPALRRLSENDDAAGLCDTELLESNWQMYQYLSYSVLFTFFMLYICTFSMLRDRSKWEVRSAPCPFPQRLLQAWSKTFFPCFPPDKPLL
eukprot:SAG31_NODE_712_length_12660_cov_9.298463_2_plen_100_part_00